VTDTDTDTDTDEETLTALLKSKPHLYQSSVFLSRQARGFEEGMAKGRVAGTAEALMQVLVSQGRELTEEQHRRISTCEDVAQLMVWIRRAAMVPPTAEVLEPCRHVLYCF
jgi:hypothetical protein